MKALILLGFLISVPAFAQDYTCLAKANANRGLPVDLEITLHFEGAKESVLLKVNGTQKTLGDVSQVATLETSNAEQKPAFDLTLGLIHEPDVSGIPEDKLSSVTSVKISKVKLPSDDEASVFQIYAGTEQIGGTIMVSGLGTACLPKASN